MRDEKNNNDNPSKSSQLSFYKCQLKWKENKNTIGSIHSQMRKRLDIIKLIEKPNKNSLKLFVFMEILCSLSFTSVFISLFDTVKPSNIPFIVYCTEPFRS